MAGLVRRVLPVVAGRLGDRVKWWTTLNEPFVVAEQGHSVGAHAPGMRNIFATGHAVHNQLRAHVAGLGRPEGGQRRVLSVGIALHNAAVWPASEAEEDIDGGRDGQCLAQLPAFLGAAGVRALPPGAGGAAAARTFPSGYEEDMDGATGASGLCRAQLLPGYRVRHDAASWLGFAEFEEPGAPRTTMNWVIRPEGLASHPQPGARALQAAQPARHRERRLFRRPPGRARCARPRPDAYLKSHVAEVLRARDEGVPVQGYFVWSLLDNFEWALGYSKRFGIVYVDFETQERVIKDSGYWYGRFVREQLSGGEEAQT